MRIFQLSDTHLPSEDVKVDGIDVKQHFLDIIGRVEAHQPDAIVLSGDLCYKEGNRNTYRWIRSILEKTGPPFFIIPGNHDDSIMIRDVFLPDYMLPEEKKLYYKMIFGEDLILFLDSGDATLGSQQLDWLKSQIESWAGNRVTIFMHHPPAVCGVPHMDAKHGLKDMLAFQKLIFKMDKSIHVYSGHYHAHLNMILKNMSINICPAGFYQMDRTFESFAIEHEQPGYLIIDLGMDKVSSHAHIIV